MDNIKKIIAAHGKYEGPALWFGSILLLILAVMSVLGICSTDACGKAHEYAVLGVNMSWFGIWFSLALMIATFVTGYWRFMMMIPRLMIASAVGAETVFIHIQKEFTGWCPLCLVIASVVFVIAIILMVQGIKHIGEAFRTDFSKTAKIAVSRTAALVFCAFFGLFISLTASAKENPAMVSDVPNVQPSFNGVAKSNTEVIFVTDWFCPACRAMDEELLAEYEKRAKTSKVAFVDVPFHMPSLSVIPFSAEVFAKNPERYAEARRVIGSLITTQDKAPTDQQIQEGLAKIGVSVTPPGRAESYLNIRRNALIGENLGVTRTPTVIVRNATTGKVVKLEGVKQITDGGIERAVQQAGQL